MPISYHVDFAVLRDNKITAFLEIKCRDIKYDTYPDIILSFNKYMYGCELCNKIKVPFIFAIGLMSSFQKVN